MTNGRSSDHNGEAVCGPSLFPFHSNFPSLFLVRIQHLIRGPEDHRGRPYHTLYTRQKGDSLTVYPRVGETLYDEVSFEAFQNVWLLRKRPARWNDAESGYSSIRPDLISNSLSCEQRLQRVYHPCLHQTQTLITNFPFLLAWSRIKWSQHCCPGGMVEIGDL